MAYEEFARIYDWALDELPYEGWVRYLKKVFQRFDADPKLVLDLGCGTGALTNLMAQNGYEMIGVDLSEDMLAIAKDKAKEQELEVVYLHQDMTELDLYGTVDAVISCGDALNYILDEEDLLEVFRKVNLFLGPGGLFVFDMNTAYKFKEILGNRTYAESREDSAYIWENYYYEDEQINEYEVTVFIENEDGAFRRTKEIHHERAYSVEHIWEMLEKAGLKGLGVYHDNSFEPVSRTTERVYFVAKEYTKQSC